MLNWRNKKFTPWQCLLLTVVIGALLRFELGGGESCSAQESQAAGQIGSGARVTTNDPIEKIKGYGQLVSSHGFQDFVINGAFESECFRQDYLRATTDGATTDGATSGNATTGGEAVLEPKVRTLARLAVAFKDRGSEWSAAGRPGLSDFKLSAEQIVASFSGTVSASGIETLQGFAGKWFGRWTDFEVDHHWSDVVRVDPGWTYLDAAKKKADVSATELLGWEVESFEYAWIGDGYGVNVIARNPTTSPKQQVLLGYVEHIKDGDFAQVTARRPHVGIDAGAGKLIWITAREVFFEQAIKTAGAPSAYAITGFHYTVSNSKMSITDGFQAIYSRDKDHRPAFMPIEVKIEEPRRNKKAIGN